MNWCCFVFEEIKFKLNEKNVKERNKIINIKVKRMS